MPLFGKLFSKRPLAPIRRLSDRPGQVQKSVSKTEKRGLFEKEKNVPVKRLFWEARKPVVIPGTGGKLMSGRKHQELVKRSLPHKKIGSHLTPSEAKKVLRQLRKEDRGIPSRERRVIEKEWGLKGKY